MAISFFGFVLNEFLLGFIYGCWFYRRKVTLARIFCACLTAVLVLNLCLTPLWLHIMYGNAFVLSAARLLKTPSNCRWTPRCCMRFCAWWKRALCHSFAAGDVIPHSGTAACPLPWF